MGQGAARGGTELVGAGGQPRQRLLRVAHQRRRGGVCIRQVLGVPAGQRGHLQLRQQAAHAQRRVKLPGRAGCDSAAPAAPFACVAQLLFKRRAHVHVVDQLAGGNAGQPGVQLAGGALRQVNVALRHAEPGQPAAVARALVHRQQN